MKTYFAYTESPIGRVLLTGRKGVLTGLHFVEHPGATSPPAGSIEQRSIFDEAVDQLESYFRGERKSFDLQFEAEGTPFQKAVWRTLPDVEYGAVASYGDIACAIGRPGAGRAVGGAIGRNPVPIIVPCHRVIGSNGKLTGFGWGLERKQWLLDLEMGRSLRLVHQH